MQVQGMKRTLALSLLSLCMGACALFSIPVESGALLFQDDFSNTKSGWDQTENETYSAAYHQGAYRIQVHTTNREAWARPGLEFSSVQIETSATKVNGPDDNMFGVFCRYQSPSDFIFFVISSDGFAGIGVVQDGERQLLSGQTMLPSDAIVLGEGRNYLRARCTQDRLSLFVNGVMVHDLPYQNSGPGDVGLLAASYEIGGVEIEFDSFTVTNP